MANIIFDFDGTIADSLNAIVEVMEELLGGKDKLNADKLNTLRELPLPKVAEELDIKKWRIPLLLIKGRKRMGNHIAELSAFSGMPQVIKQLKSDGNRLFIISTNDSSNIHIFLKKQKLLNYFDQVYGSVGIFKKSKALRRLAKKNHLILQDSVYIGDESRDIESANAVGISCIAVDWGFSNEQTLSKYQPYAIAKHPEDIPAIIRRRFQLLQ